MSTVGVMTEGAEVVTGPVEVDVEMERMGDGHVGPPTTPVSGGMPVPVVVRAQALLIHGVDCPWSVRALLAAARGLRLGVCGVQGVR